MIGAVKAWPLWTLRVLVTLEGVLVFNQAVFAGQFLAGDFGALSLHRFNADLAGTVALLQLVAAILLRSPGRGPAWPIAVTGALLLLVGVQTGLGFGRVLALHVPLGVAIALGTAFLLVRVWRLDR